MATNVPPPPAPGVPPVKKTSPVVWILVGCGGIIVIGILAILALGGLVYFKAKQAGLDPQLLQRHPELAAVKFMVAANPDAELVSIDEDRGIVTVRDKKTGKVVTLNFEDIKHGRLRLEQDGKKIDIQGKQQGGQASLEITGPDGKASFGAGTMELPSWLPAYGGAKADGITSKKGETTSGTFTLRTTDSADKVAGYYEDTLKRSGLTVETTTTGGGAVVTGKSENRQAGVTIYSAAGTTVVTGTFEEK